MTLYSRSEDNAQSLKVLNTTEKNSVDKYDWDNTLIVDGDSTVVGAQGYATAARRTIFVDDVEATLAENRERGLTAPGWWEYMTYTDASGNTRHKAQHLVAFKDAPVNAADLDDNVVADVASAINIQTNLFNQAAVPDPWTDPAAFSIVASATTGNILYQWQVQTANATTRWTNLADGANFAGTNSPVLAVNNLDKATYDGYKFRVKMTTDAGAEEVISDVGQVLFA